MMSYKKEIDELAIGLTRSATFMGINVKLFFANLFVSAMLSINISFTLGIIAFFIFHVLILKLSIKEPNFVFLYRKAYLKTMPIMNFSFWGKTNSYEAW